VAVPSFLRTRLTALASEGADALVSVFLPAGLGGDSNGNGVSLCEAGGLQTFRFDRARSLFRYEDLVVRAVVKLKFEEMEPLAGGFTDRSACTESWHGGSRCGSAGAAAQSAGTGARIEPAGAAIEKAGKTPESGTPGRFCWCERGRGRTKYLLNERERWEAVRGAFATPASSLIDKKRVLLVDD